MTFREVLREIDVFLSKTVAWLDAWGNNLLNDWGSLTVGQVVFTLLICGSIYKFLSGRR